MGDRCAANTDQQTPACVEAADNSSITASLWAVALPAWAAVQDARTRGHSELKAALAHAVLIPALFDVRSETDPRCAPCSAHVTTEPGLLALPLLIVASTS